MQVATVASAISPSRCLNGPRGRVRLCRSRSCHSRPLGTTSPAIRPLIYARRSSFAIASAEVSLQDKETTADLIEPGSFVWTRAWYPVLRAKDIPPKTPTAIELLGKRLVIWQAPDGSFSTMDDVCPHKLAPLSLGKVTDEGALMCRYHGWCFNGSGKCTKIPMATSETRESRICSDERSAVASYPTIVKQGLVWVWPDASPEAVAAAAATEPPVQPGFKGDFVTFIQQPADYISFAENSFDPSHANFLHEGLGFGDKYSPETAMPMVNFKLEGKATSLGFELSHRGYSKGTEEILATRMFYPPSTVTTTYLSAKKGAVKTQLHFVPVRPGRTGIFFQFKSEPLTPEQKEQLAAAGFDLAETSTKKKSQPSPSLLKALKSVIDKVVPVWLQEGLLHRAQFSMPLALQDLSIMAGAEVAMKDRPVPWSKAYFLPTPSDQGVVVFRSWIEQFGGGGPFGPGGHIREDAGASEAGLRDNWESHTKHCSSCKRSVDFVGSVSSWFTRLGVLCWLGALAASLGPLVPSQAATPLVALGLLLYTASQGLRSLQNGWISGVRPSGNGLPNASPWKTK